MRKGIIASVIAILAALPVNAQEEVIYYKSLGLVGMPLHIFELILGVWIAILALKFFRITKPINVFLLLYVAVGVFIVNSLLYVLLYIVNFEETTVSYVSVYVASRIALIGMLMCLLILLILWNRALTSKPK